MIFLFGVIFGARLRIECMGTANFGGYSHCKVANFDSNCYDFDILKGRIFGYLRKKVIILLPYFETTDRILSNTGSKAEISRTWGVFSSLCILYFCIFGGNLQYLKY